MHSSARKEPHDIHGTVLFRGWGGDDRRDRIVRPLVVEFEQVSKQDDGGPAFPTNSAAIAKGESGMSLRDWLGGQALAGVLAAEAHPRSNGAVPVDENAARFVALNVWRYVDAMLIERKQDY
jgi:hypothetical protein